MKRKVLFQFLSVIAATAIVFTIAVTASASDLISIYVDGEKLTTDVPPQIIADRVMLPVRAVSEAVGCLVEWVHADQNVVVYAPGGGDRVLVMRIGDPIVDVTITSGDDGSVTESQITIDSPPVIIDGRTLAPLRFIAEFIGYRVDWDGETRTVNLNGALGN